MTQYETCRDWLNSYRELRLEAKRLSEKHEMLMNQATSITARYSPTPGGGGGGDSKDRLLCVLADADTETMERLADAEERAQEIERFIERIPNGAHRAVLRSRYLALRSWRNTRRALAHAGMGYSEDYIYRLHREALKEAEQLWKTTQNS